MRSVADTRASALAQGAALLALAACLGLAEALWLPELPVPGLRLGLANLAVLVALVALGPAQALFVSLGRVVVVGLATGTLFGPVALISAAGALASWTVMVALRSRGPAFSVVGWSVGGSAAHVLAQLTAAAVLASTAAVFALTPLTLALSLPSGLAIGLLARTLLSRISRLSVSFVG
jgi:heptaprenyl diphosphate synthase